MTDPRDLEVDGSYQSPVDDDAGSLGKKAFWGLLILAIAGLGWWLRRSACRESLWVDELHTAWVVSGTFSQLIERCAVGNQTPWYFGGLWAWCQLFGASAWTLRLPSVILSLCGCAVIAVAGVQLSGRWVVGIAVGLAMAIERNGIFYGSEARGYAAVLFAMTLVAWGTLFLMNEGLPSGRSKARTWLILLGLFAASLVATLVHVTAAWSIAFLACSAGLIIVLRILHSASEPRKPLRASAPFRKEQAKRLFALLATVGGGSCLALAIHAPYLMRTWDLRDQWQAFAVPRSIREFGTIWPWLWCIVVPSVLAAMAPQARRTSKDYRLWRMVAVLGLAAGLATIAAWFVASQGWMALWHRRFLIGVLPMIYLLGGLLWGWVDQRWREGVETKLKRRRSRHRARYGDLQGRRLSRPFVIGIGVTTILLSSAVIVLSEGTWRNVVEGESSWVRRGEDWRGAARYLAGNRASVDSVWIDAGLIESRWLTERSPGDLSRLQQEYLTFPLRSIYSAGVFEGSFLVPVSSIGASDFPKQWLEESRRAFSESSSGRLEEVQGMEASLWLVVRSNATASERAMNRMVESWNAERRSGEFRLRLEEPVAAFGNVTVGRVRKSH